MSEQPPHRPDFLEAYNAIEVPSPLLATKVLNDHVTITANNFFAAVEASLDMSPRTMAHFFTYSEEGNFAEGEYRKRFRRRGGQTLASLVYTHDIPRRHVAYFATYPLLATTEADIRAYQQMERIEFGLDA